ncbi:TraM recognition domain-containing protein [Peptococcaceae bacterium 1198_IL3148]
MFSMLQNMVVRRVLVSVLACIIGIPLAGFFLLMALNQLGGLMDLSPLSVNQVDTKNLFPFISSFSFPNTISIVIDKVTFLLKNILIICVPVLIIILICRLYFRDKRLKHMEQVEIVLSRDDTAEPFEVMTFFDSCYAALVTRNFSIFKGHDHMLWEIIKEDNGNIRFYIGAPNWAINGIKARLQSTYQNITFTSTNRITSDYDVRQQFGLARKWIYPLRSLRNYQSSITESLVSVLAVEKDNVRLQFLLTPKGLGFQKKVKLMQKAYEQTNIVEKLQDKSDTGMGYVEDKELKSALEITGKGVFSTEIRLCCDSYEATKSVAGVLGEASGENRLIQPGVIGGTILRLNKKLWLRWLNLRMPSILLFRKCILSSFHLATIIHLPSVRVRVANLNRAPIRRAAASMKISRDSKYAIMKDENGPVGILPEDRKYNNLLFGTQGGGKSTVIERLVYSDAQILEKAQVIIDPNNDMAKTVLGLIPPSRKVIFVDASDENCPWSINPFKHYLSKDVLVDNQIRTFIQKWGQSAIGPKSEEFLANTMYALLDTQSNFTYLDVFRMLVDQDFRDRVIMDIKDPFQRMYWTQTFIPMQENNPKALEERLQAPRNKLNRILSVKLVNRILTGPNPIDFYKELHDEKAIIVVNLPKGLIGSENAFLIGIWVISEVWNVIQRQSALAQEKRVKISIILEELKNLLCDDLENVLSEGRKYGAETTVAFQHYEQIDDEKLLSAIRTLIQNIILFRTQEVEDAERFTKLFMRLYSNMIQVNDDVQDRINFGPDDIFNIPVYHAICRWMVKGEPQAPFVGKTMPVDDLYRSDWAEYHISRQHEYASNL